MSLLLKMPNNKLPTCKRLRGREAGVHEVRDLPDVARVARLGTSFGGPANR